MFLDLAGFTTLTHGFDPERVRDLADEILTVVAGIIEQFDGHVDAFRGDGLIAVFGAPRSHPDDPDRAVQAAAAGLRAIERIGASKDKELKGRAGVATGVVIAGTLGSGRVREYTVMGSTVNLAARIEAAATPGEVWVDPATERATRYRMDYRPSGPVKLGGFPDVTELFVLQPSEAQVHRDPFLNLRFVGRQAELQRLSDVHRQVITSSTPAPIWVTGPTGIGKTRLVQEFTATHLAGESLVLWPEERTGSSWSWYPLARELFQRPESGSSDSWQGRLQERVAELMPDEPRWARHVLASVGLQESADWHRQERRRYNRTSHAWRDFLVRIAEVSGKSIILVLHDRPEDRALKDFITLLLQAQAPIMLVQILRDTDAGDEAHRLVVPPLSVHDSLVLLNQLADPVMRPATEALVYQVGGVPAYILELGRALSMWEDGNITGSLEGVMQARLDRLDEEMRQLLVLAALAGEASWEPMLLEAADLGNSTAPLVRLEDENLLVRSSETSLPGLMQYRFQSELLRQAVLRTIPHSEKPRLHLRLAGWLEQHAPLQLSWLVAEQFEQGGQPEAALTHYLSALDLALGEGQQPDRQLTDAISRLRLSGTARQRAQLALAHAALASRDAAAAREALQAAAEGSMSELGEQELQLLQARLAQLESTRTD